MSPHRAQGPTMDGGCDGRKRIAYIAHPVAGDVEGNIRSILSILREIRLNADSMAEWEDIIPVAPYVVALQYLSDSEPGERLLGMEENTAYFESGFIDELILAGDAISKGMRAEVGLAYSLGIPVTCYNPALEAELDAIMSGMEGKR